MNRRAVAVVAAAVVSTLVLAAAVIWFVRQTEPAPPRATFVVADSLAIAPPEELGVGETLVRTEVLGPNDVAVTHWLRSRALMFTVRLALPPGARRRGLVAEDVLVVTDGRAADGATRISRKAVRYRFIGASTVQVSYRLTGAVEPSDSVPGRALVRTTALDVEPDVPSERVLRTVSATRVLSLACSSPASSIDLTPCGSVVTDGEWRVEQDGPGDAERVSAAVDVDPQG